MHASLRAHHLPKVTNKSSFDLHGLHRFVTESVAPNPALTLSPHGNLGTRQSNCNLEMYLTDITQSGRGDARVR